MARIVQIGKRRWLAGLAWSSFEAMPVKAELKEDAQRLNASWVCVRSNDGVIQGGFCPPVDHIKYPVKLYSLAAMLADSHERRWMGIFKIRDDLWWYIAVRDGDAILPDGDIIGSEAEIHAARDRHAGYGDWKHVEGDIDSLSELISKVDAKPTPVYSLEGSPLPVVPIVSVIALVGALGTGWWHHRQQQEEAMARAEAIAKMRAQMMANQTIGVAPSPLLTTPQPNDWLSACGDVISALPLSQYGWALDQAGCDATSATIRWVRQEGAAVTHKPEGNLSPQGDEIDQIIPLKVDAHGKNDAIDLPNAKLIFRAWAQKAGFPLTFMEPPPAPVLPGAAASAPQDGVVVPPPPPQANVILEIPVSPFRIDMSSIPGLRLTNLKSNGPVWNVNGTLYGR